LQVNSLLVESQEAVAFYATCELEGVTRLARCSGKRAQYEIPVKVLLDLQPSSGWIVS